MGELFDPFEKKMGKFQEKYKTFLAIFLSVYVQVMAAYDHLKMGNAYIQCIVYRKNNNS